MEASTSDASPPRRGDAVSIAAVLAAAMAIGTVMQFVLGALAPFLTTDLGLGRASVGMLTAILFTVAGLASPVLGTLVDRVSIRASMLVLLGSSTAAFLLMTSATAYWLLVLAMVIAGIPQALANPVTNRAVTLHTSLVARGLVMGSKQSGVQLGAFVAGMSLPFLASALDWRAAAGIVAVVTGLAALVLPLRFPRRSCEVLSGDEEQESTDGHEVRSVVSWLGVYAFFMGGGMSALQTYLPLYAFERLGFSAALAGTLVAIMGFIGVGARIVWGDIGNRATRLTRPLMVLAVGSLLGLVLIMLAGVLAPWLLWPGLFLLGGTAASWNVVAMVALVRTLPASQAGRGSGLFLVGFFLGFVVAPPVFGITVDLTESYTVAWAIAAALFAVGSIVPIQWQRRIRQAR